MEYTQGAGEGRGGEELCLKDVRIRNFLAGGFLRSTQKIRY